MHEKIFKSIYRRKGFMSTQDYLPLLNKAKALLLNEAPYIRPRDNMNLSGGLVCLHQDIPTIIIPDIHARQEVFINILAYKGLSEYSVLERLQKGLVQIVCVGDAFHAEARAAQRWKKAFKEFSQNYRHCPNMDQEMLENFNTLEMILVLKLSFPEHFHFLKGNHENILNEEGFGNHPFGKFVFEGEMVKHWVQSFMGDEILYRIADIEKAFPLLAAGNEFLISHAEPFQPCKKSAIINYRSNSELIYHLTWTADGEANEGSVEAMFDEFAYKADDSFYFAGHRPVSAVYRLQQKGKFIQLHNPQKIIYTEISKGSEFNAEKHIHALEDNTEEIIKRW